MSGIKRRHIIIFYITTALFWAAIYTYQPTMSPYLKSIGVSYSMIGVIGGSYGFTQMLLRIPLGILSDRLGRRKAFIVGGVFMSALSSLILYLADSTYAILLGRSLAGVAASSWVVFTVLFSSYSEKGRAASRISFLSMCNNTGQVAAMLIGGISAGYFGYKFPFILGALIGALGLIVSFFVKENVPSRNRPLKIIELLAVVKNKNLVVMSVLAILSQMVLFGAALTFTPVVAAGLNASSNELGYMSMLSNIPRILSALFCGVLLTHSVNIKKLVSLSFALLAAGSIATPFCPNLWALYAASIITGFGSGISMTVLLSLCTRDIEAERHSAAMGFFQAIYGVGMFVGPVVIGVFADGFGMTWGFVFSALISIIGIAGSLIFIEG